jgi:hypothetical protein
MKECVLCGKELDINTDQSYSYDKYLHEIDRQSYEYCKQCNEILRVDKSRKILKNKILKVNISKSDYYLPGYVLSKDKMHYIKCRKRKSIQKRVMDIGTSLQ